MNKRRVVVIAALALSLMQGILYAQEITKTKVIFFFSPSCHRCEEVKSEVMPRLEREFAGRLEIEYRDISDLKNYSEMLSLKQAVKSDIDLIVPVLYINGQFINSRMDVEHELRKIIPKQGPSAEASVLAINLLEHFKSFKPLAIIIAGLTDGINPCAFTVIVFFMSFLALQGYRRREIAVIGLLFIFAVFVTYILIGLGLFNFLYRIKTFWVVARVINLSIGVLSIILGCAAIYDAIKFVKTRQTEGLILQLPEAVKRKIHKVIGMHYRQPKDGKGKKASLAALSLSALSTGFLVSILEAVCTGQVYLPTITFVLKTTALKMVAFWYLLLYNSMFIFPLLVIFFFALQGTSSGQFSLALKKNMLLVKVSMAAVFFALGILLLWR